MSRFLNSRLNRLAPYVPGEQPRNTTRLIKLNTNENPYPPGNKVKEALANAACDQLRLYPDPDTTALIAAAAQVYGVKRSQILLGNGSDELLAFAFKLLVKMVLLSLISAMAFIKYGQAYTEIFIRKYRCGQIYRLPLRIMKDKGNGDYCQPQCTHWFSFAAIRYKVSFRTG